MEEEGEEGGGGRGEEGAGVAVRGGGGEEEGREAIQLEEKEKKEEEGEEEGGGGRVWCLQPLNARLPCSPRDGPLTRSVTGGEEEARGAGTSLEEVLMRSSRLRLDSRRVGGSSKPPAVSLVSPSHQTGGTREPCACVLVCVFRRVDKVAYWTAQRRGWVGADEGVMGVCDCSPDGK